MTQPQAKQKMIRNSACFSPKSMERLRSVMSELEAKAGERLYWDGEPADRLYFVIRGSVRLTKFSDEGKQFVLHMFRDGDLFGQLVPFRDVTYDSNAEVAEPSVIGVIQKTDIEVLLQQHNEMAIEFLKWMGLIDRINKAKFRDLLLFGKLGALCSMLIRLQNSHGAEHPKGTLIDKKLTNTDLAEMIGATRESVNRLLSELRAAKAITNDNGYLVVQNLQYLKEICRCEECPDYVCRT